MAIRLFNLRNVPDDEADEIRQLLEQHNIDFYETPPGGWGISAASFWVQDERQLEEAKALIDGYQKERALKARQEYERLKREGQLPSVLDKILEKPLQFLFYVLLIAFFAYISISPFVNLGQ